VRRTFGYQTSPTAIRSWRGMRACRASSRVSPRSCFTCRALTAQCWRLLRESGRVRGSRSVQVLIGHHTNTSTRPDSADANRDGRASTRLNAHSCGTAEVQAVLRQSLGGDLAVTFLDLDADGAPVEILRRKKRGTGTGERISDDA
jgi:hypothetical protein